MRKQNTPAVTVNISGTKESEIYIARGKIGKGEYEKSN